jgi:hypothetical protein
MGEVMASEPRVELEHENYLQESLEALSSFTDIAERNELSAIRVLDIMRSAESDMLETTIQAGSPRDLFKSWRTITRGRDDIVRAGFDQETEKLIIANPRMIAIVNRYPELKSSVYAKSHDVDAETKKLKMEQLRLRWVILFGRLGNAALDGYRDEETA